MLGARGVGGRGTQTQQRHAEVCVCPQARAHGGVAAGARVNRGVCVCDRGEGAEYVCVCRECGEGGCGREGVCVCVESDSGSVWKCVCVCP